MRRSVAPLLADFRAFRNAQGKKFETEICYVVELNFIMYTSMHSRMDLAMGHDF